MFPIGNIFAALYPLPIAGNADKAPVIAIDGALGLGKGARLLAGGGDPGVSLLESRVLNQLALGKQGPFPRAIG
jgi:hypothetical protein